MVGLLIVNDYEIRPNSWCNLADCNDMNLSEAKHKCSADSSCNMFYDAFGAGTSFCLCRSAAVIKTSSHGAILYNKKSEYTRVCTPTCKPIIW